MDSNWPVSVKGVVMAAGHVLLVRNERQEWELPGGRLERGESPPQCVQREIEEETGLVVTVDRILDSWVYPVRPDHPVLIVTYRCLDVAPQPDGLPSLAVSDEHNDARWVPIDEVDSLVIPNGYRRSIKLA